ncbi:hypothetical protein F5Y11DRAFT_123129 [Daldinia sp. FL1419]|nr:hypothetical protein F5Y11DRAFT_123129 [Daldinia sp. FL1419]
MTTPVSGSSLPQTRDVHQHNHFHNSRETHQSHHHHNHNHQHTHHARSQNGNKRGHKRADSEPTIIVETVSVLELIDSAGVPITTQTLTTSQPTPSTSSSYITSSEPDVTVEPTTTTTATNNSSTSTSTSSNSSSSSTTTTTSPPISNSASVPALPTSAPGTSDDEGDGLSSTSIPTIDPTVAPSESSMPTIFPTLSYSPLTSTPLSGSPVFPSLAGVTNTTQSSSSTLSPNSTSSTSLPPFSIEGFNTSVSASSGTASSSDFSTSSPTTTTSSDPTSTTFGSFGVPTQTDDSSVGVGNAQPSSTSAVATDDDSSSNGPEAATVAGSVLGGVAALAGLLILALFLLRWKKRQNTARLMRGSMSERGPGGGLVGNSGPGGGDGGMSETRRSIPFAIPAALASLTGYKRFSGRSAASADGGERGFSKVSGRKLPPVIQFGGDGYSDPRDTVLSDQSIEYRDSAFPGLGGGLAPTRLAVGAPMRPESGIPVFNPGPARTPKTEQATFSPVLDNSPLEPPRDPLGRSHPSYDGSSRSHGSASRFTEEL